MRPIPASVQFDDPIWISRFLDLADLMVWLGGKPKLICRYTGLAPKEVALRYKALTGREAQAGRLPQSKPGHYALPSKHRGLDWNLQAAAFASIYLRIEAALTEPVNRGWLLATAYLAYLRLTDPLRNSIRDLQRLEFNSAYDLMTLLGRDKDGKSAPLELRNCNVCGTSYLYITGWTAKRQACPMCGIQRQLETPADKSRTYFSLRRRKSA